ncbi:peroxisomal multifunctional enzyme type 2-like isoform X2 [Amphiura filiformis]
MMLTVRQLCRLSQKKSLCSCTARLFDPGNVVRQHHWNKGQNQLVLNANGTNFHYFKKAACRQYNKDVGTKADLVKAIGYRCEWRHNYTAHDAILYALGVGVSTTQSDYLKFLFEKDDNFCVLPSYGFIPAQKEVLLLTLEGRLPGLANLDPAKVLHGEQYMEVFRPMLRAATLRNECVVVDVIDKRSGALILFDVNTYDDKDTLITYNQFSIFIVGFGGFGGKKTSNHEKPTIKPPARPAEYSVSQATSIDQAALYRLSGDYNPLHFNPTVAARVGFSKPILHGLCTLAYGIRHVLQQYANNDVAKFKAVKVRFSKPVYPGQTINTNMWRDGNRVYFQCEVTETKDVVISGAYVDFHHID